MDRQAIKERALGALIPEGASDDVLAEASAIVDLVLRQVARFDKNELLLRAGNGAHSAHLVLEGWAMRYKVLADGRRQILDLILPGDLVGVVSMFMRQIEWSVSALTPMKTVAIHRGQILDMRAGAPAVYEHLLWQTLGHLTRLAEQVVRLGTKGASERMAHLILETHSRLRTAGLDVDYRIPFPVTQSMMAEQLGVSAVHLNRTLRQMEDDAIIRHDRTGIQILDMAKLETLSDFDGSYLHGPRLPPLESHADRT